MRPRRLPLLVPLALALALGARGAVAEDGRPGRIVLSDGTASEGRLSFTQGVRLHLVDPATGKGRDLLPDLVAALLFRVQKESMERPFTFRMPGKDDKTYGEGLYPLRELLCTVVTRAGERIDGHLKTTVVLLEGAGDEEGRRFVLRRQWKGAVGDTLDDLVYPREVRFTDVPDPAAAKPASIEVVVRGCGALRFAAAYGLASRLVFAGAIVDAKAGLARFEGLPPDDYDLAVLGETVAVVGSARTAQATRPIVDAEDAGPLAEIVAKGDDLYDRRASVAVGGDREGARLVVEKRVTRRTTNDDAFGRRGALVAIDVWTAHRLEREWRVDARANLLRVILLEGEVPPRVAPDARLAAVRVAAGERARREVDWTEAPR